MAKAVSDTIRKAIRESGRSLYNIAGHTGIDASRLSRFMRKERELGSKSIDILCRELKLTLKQERRSRK